MEAGSSRSKGEAPAKGGGGREGRGGNGRKDQRQGGWGGVGNGGVNGRDRDRGEDEEKLNGFEWDRGFRGGNKGRRLSLDYLKGWREGYSFRGRKWVDGCNRAEQLLNGTGCNFSCDFLVVFVFILENEKNRKQR